MRGIFSRAVLRSIAPTVVCGLIIHWRSYIFKTPPPPVEHSTERCCFRRLIEQRHVGVRGSDVSQPQPHHQVVSVLNRIGGSRMGFSLRDYTRLKPLASGGCGEVFRAREKRLDRTVVLKKIGAAWDMKMRRMCANEARTAAGLHHPNIIKIFNFGQAHNSVYVVMECIDGVNLEEILMQGVEKELALYAMIDVCDALAFAHSRGVIHRDLKPSNILIDCNGVSHLSDFGLAVRKTDVRMADSGRVSGTIRYMAPEIFADSQAACEATDLYSLGVILYRIVTGSFPFPDDISNGPDAVTILRNAQPRPEELSGTPEPLRDAILRCLDTDPGHRTTTAAAIRDIVTASCTDTQNRSRLGERVRALASMNEEAGIVRIQSMIEQGALHDAYFLLKDAINCNPADARLVPLLDTLHQCQIRKQRHTLFVSITAVMCITALIAVAGLAFFFTRPRPLVGYPAIEKMRETTVHDNEGHSDTSPDLLADSLDMTTDLKKGRPESPAHK